MFPIKSLLSKDSNILFLNIVRNPLKVNNYFRTILILNYSRRYDFDISSTASLNPITNPHFKWGLKNAPKGSVTARLKGGCRKHILPAAAKKRLLHFLPSGTLLTAPVYISLWHPPLHFLPLPHNSLLPRMLYSIYFVAPDACHISSAVCLHTACTPFLLEFFLFQHLVYGHNHRIMGCFHCSSSLIPSL